MVRWNNCGRRKGDTDTSVDKALSVNGRACRRDMKSCGGHREREREGMGDEDRRTRALRYTPLSVEGGCSRQPAGQQKGRD